MMKRIQKLLEDGVITYDGERIKLVAPIMMATDDPSTEIPPGQITENVKISDHSNVSVTPHSSSPVR